ncbi:hypothetical protein POP12_049 [Pectobacterium phage POP12]|nr:hypothetical protein POP12_049 [Pectobacterium phage POP12]
MNVLKFYPVIFADGKKIVNSAAEFDTPNLAIQYATDSMYLERFKDVRYIEAGFAEFTSSWVSVTAEEYWDKQEAENEDFIHPKYASYREADLRLNEY